MMKLLFSKIKRMMQVRQTILWRRRLRRLQTPPPPKKKHLSENQWKVLLAFLQIPIQILILISKILIPRLKKANWTSCEVN